MCYEYFLQFLTFRLIFFEHIAIRFKGKGNFQEIITRRCFGEEEKEKEMGRNLDLLSCWWVVSQVFQGFFNENWNWRWLRKVLEKKNKDEILFNLF